MEDFLDAVADNEIDRARSFLQSGVDANAMRGKQPALLLATQSGNLEMIKLLLAYNAEVDKLDGDYGTTALMVAAEEGNRDIVRFLLASGAKLNIEDFAGKSALAHAIQAKKEGVVEALQQAGARAAYPRTVLVMGAGFTKAFLPGAPLLIDDYAVMPELTTKYIKMQYAYNVLKNELERYKDANGEEKRVDMERLMTRLIGGMPYDRDLYAHNQLASLLDDLKLHFIKKINSAKDGTYHWQELHALALVCLIHRIDCITFNYDDVFDEALWDAIHPSSGIEGWSPNTGYGFFCSSSEDCIDEPWRQHIYDDSCMQLLKIHGSINWRVRRGAKEPYRMEDIVHHTLWYLRGTRCRDESGNHLHPTENRLHKADRIIKHLENEPFIVPPILTKASLNQEPLLRSLWLNAFNTLRQAERVIFVGYSLPITDIAASYLFSEAAPYYPIHPDVYVVDYAPVSDKQKRQVIKNAYRRIYPELSDDHFRFDGGRNWAQSFVTEYGGVEGVLQWASNKLR